MESQVSQVNNCCLRFCLQDYNIYLFQLSEINDDSQTQTCFIAKNPISEEKCNQTQKLEINLNSQKYIEEFFPKKRSFLSPKCEKFILLAFSFLLITIVCTFSIFAIISEIFLDIGTRSAEITSFNVTNKLVTYLNNLTNSSIPYEIKCPTNFIHSNSSLFCSPACNHLDYVFSDTALLVDTIILLCIDITGAILGILTLATWPFVKSFWKFPQVTILFLVVCLTLLISFFILTDIPGFYCGFDSSYSYDDLIANFQPQLMSAGAIIHFLRISIMFWTFFTLLNILLSTFGPSVFNPNGKGKNILVTMEIIIAFGIPTLFVITTLSLQINLFWNAFGAFPDYLETAPYILGRIIPDYLTATFSLVLVILILTRLRYMSINTKSILGDGRKLTPLEIRLVIYSVVSSLVFYFFIVEVIQYLTLFEAEFSQLYNFRACVTLGSPIVEKYGNVSVYHNVTYQLIPETVWNNGEVCEGIKPFLERYPPIWLSVYNICYRLIVNAFFLIFILKSNVLVWIGWFKCVCFRKSK